MGRTFNDNMQSSINNNQWQTISFNNKSMARINGNQYQSMATMAINIIQWQCQWQNSIEINGNQQEGSIVRVNSHDEVQQQDIKNGKQS